MDGKRRRGVLFLFRHRSCGGAGTQRESGSSAGGARNRFEASKRGAKAPLPRPLSRKRERGSKAFQGARFNASTAFKPPNANELLSTARTGISRATFGT